MSAGTVFTEIDLDTRKFDAAQKRILYDAKTMAVNVEDAWKVLGQKSDVMYNAMRKQAENAYQRISADSKSSSAERIRAEEAMHKRISDLNEQQFGKQTSLLDTLKSHWVATSAAVVAAWVLVHKAFALAEEGAKVLAIQDSFKLMADSAKVNGEAMIAQMGKVTASTIDDSQMMLQAQRLLAQGLSQNQIVKLSETARVAARFMGVDVKNAFEMITESVITGNVRGLRPFGITMAATTQAIEKHASALGTVPGYLSEYGRSQAIVNEIIKKGEENTKLLGGELHPNLSEKFQQLNAVANEVKETMGIAMLPVFGAVSVVALSMSSGIMALASAYSLLEAQMLKLSLFEEKRKQAPEWEQRAADLMELAKNLDIAARDGGKLIISTLDVLREEINKRVKGINETLSGKPSQIGVAGVGPATGKPELDYEAMAKDRLPIIKKYEEEASKAALEVFNAGWEKIKNAAILNATQTFQSVEVIERQLSIEGAKQRLDDQVDILNKERDRAIEEVQKTGLMTETLRAQIVAVYADKEKAARIKTGNEITAIEIKQAKERADAIAESYKKQGYGYEVPTDKETTEWDARSAQLIRDRAINTADLNKQVFELQGNWIAAREAEISFNDATLDNYIKTHNLTDQQEILLKQLNDIKNAELEAQKNMDVGKLIEIGSNKAVIDLNKDLINQYETLLPGGVHIFAQSLFDAVNSGQNFFQSMLTGFSQLIQKISMTIMEMEMLKALGYGQGASSGGGLLGGLFGWVGSLFGLGSKTVTGGEYGWGGYQQGFQEGGSFWTRGATHFVAGEGGEPEYVNITPKSKMGMGGQPIIYNDNRVTNNTYIDALDQKSIEDRVTGPVVRGMGKPKYRDAMKNIVRRNG